MNDWGVDDVVKWLDEIQLGILIKSIQALAITGRTLLRIPTEVILGKLKFDHQDQAVSLISPR